MLEIGSSKRAYWNKRIFWCAFIGLCLLLWIGKVRLDQYQMQLKYCDRPSYQTIHAADVYYEVMYLKPHPNPDLRRKEYRYRASLDLTYALRRFYSLERCDSAKCQKVEDSNLLKCSASRCHKFVVEDQVLWSREHHIAWGNGVDNLPMCKSTTHCEDIISIDSIPTEDLGEPLVYPYPISQFEFSGQDDDGYYYMENTIGGYDRVRFQYIPYRDLEQVTVLKISGNDYIRIGKIPLEDMLWFHYRNQFIIFISFIVFSVLVMIITLFNARLELSRWWRKLKFRGGMSDSFTHSEMNN